MTDLRLGPDLTLPLDAVTQTMGILAVKRAGKSNAAVVLAEEMTKASIPWVAIDPKGDWWGVRSSGDGKGPGLAVPVFGGEHGDVPLEPTGGNLVAELVAEQRLTCVLDVSEMTKADQRRFLTDFALRLYKRNRDPLHVFCEEADEYIPQRVLGETAKMVGAFETLVKRGGFRGIGVTLITQRSASLNKDVLTQVGTLFAMRTTSPQDRKAIAGWVEYHAASAEALASLSSLANGEAWMFSPEWLHTLERVKFRRRETFDSGSTPAVGKARREPTGLADVDLAAVKELMAETVERAKENDPDELHKRIRVLERELAETKKAKPEVITERVEVSVVPEEVLLRLEELLEPVAGVLSDVQDRLTWETKEQGGVIEMRRVKRTTAGTPDQSKAAPIARTPRPAGPSKRTASAPSSASELSGPQRKLLSVLATYGPRTKRQLALLAGYSENGGGFNNPLGALRSRSYVEKGSPITITDAGLNALGEYDELPVGPDLFDYWVAQLPGPASRILVALIEGGGSMPKADLADAAGYQPTGGGFNNPLGRLRTLGLLARGEPVELTPEFAEAIR